jgi:hypothetical protein
VLADSSLEYLTGLHIMTPVNKENLGNEVTLRVFNDDATSIGTWWSVDSGSWVAMEKSKVENVWTYTIDLSGWQWATDGQYIIHAWSFDQNQQVKHVQVVVKR